MKGYAPVEFTQNRFNHHSDEYQMKAVDVDELRDEYDMNTVEGRARNVQYENYRSRACKLFDARQKEMLLDQHHSGHIIKPIEDFVYS